MRHNEELARLLASYREQFAEQVLHDFGYNIQQLWRWAERLDPAHRTLTDARIQGGFRQLVSTRRFFVDNDQWSSSMDLPCWRAFQQFYCDALALGDRLLRTERGERPRRKPAGRLKRRQVLEGASAYGFAQAVVNALEKDIPNIFNLRPLHSPLPVGLYSGSRAILPWVRFHWPTFLRKLHYMLASGAINSLVERSGSIIEMRGKDELLSNADLYDPHTGRTRHNLIIAMSHRHSTVDLPIGAEALGGIDHAVWANELYYPKSAAQDAHVVIVCSTRKRRMEPVLRKSADIMMHTRIPVVIVVDGGGAYLPYGQQMCVKRGIRFLVDYMNQATQGTQHRTIIVPLSLDDPITLAAGLDAKVRITFHRPICTDDIAPAPRRPDRKAINRGDPLLIYLEAHFLTHTGQIRHGWRTPSVVETVRQFDRRTQCDPAVRGWLRGRFHASMFDLCRIPRE